MEWKIFYCKQEADDKNWLRVSEDAEVACLQFYKWYGATICLLRNRTLVG